MKYISLGLCLQNGFSFGFLLKHVLDGVDPGFQLRGLGNDTKQMEENSGKDLHLYRESHLKICA